MKSDKVTFQILFWSFIGPFISLFTLFVFYIKGSATPTYFPAVLLLGVPVCWKWKLKGFAGSVAVLLILFFFYYTQIPLDERFWHLGMGISMGVSLLITSLAFEEVEDLVHALKVESRSRLENLWKVDEKLQETTGELKKKRERIRELNVKVRSYQKLIDHSSEEIVELKERLEEINQELYQTKSNNTDLEQWTRKMKDEPPAEAKYAQLREQFEEKQKLLEETRKELFHANEKIAAMEKDYEEATVYELREFEQTLEKHLQQFEKEKKEQEEQHQQELDALQAMLSIPKQPQK